MRCPSFCRQKQIAITGLISNAWFSLNLKYRLRQIPKITITAISVFSMIVPADVDIVGSLCNRIKFSEARTTKWMRKNLRWWCIIFSFFKDNLQWTVLKKGDFGLDPSFKKEKDYNRLFMELRLGDRYFLTCLDNNSSSFNKRGGFPDFFWVFSSAIWHGVKVGPGPGTLGPPSKFKSGIREPPKV